MVRCAQYNKVGFGCTTGLIFPECTTCVCMMPELKKPPLGLKPKKLHRQERMRDILRAMLRYTEAGITIPREWVKEFGTIYRRLY